MEQLSWTLGVITAVLHAIAYVLYNIQAKRGDSKPNPVSWSIWTLLAALNMLSFKEAASTALALQYMVGTVGTIMTFGVTLFTGKFDWPKRREIVILIISLLSMVVWWFFRDASAANAIIMVAFLISFEPTFMGVYREPHRERPRPWVIWTIGFTILLINASLVLIVRIIAGEASWAADTMSIVNPVILLATHGSIALLSRRSRRAR